MAPYATAMAKRAGPRGALRRGEIPGGAGSRAGHRDGATPVGEREPGRTLATGHRSHTARGPPRAALSRRRAHRDPVGPPPRGIEAIRREAPRPHLYPDGGCTELRQALAAWLDISADSIVVGNGADELLAMLA